jgi:type I restriction enzyme, S subunit
MEHLKTTIIDKKIKLPNGWVEKRLIDCCKTKAKYGINASAVNYHKDLPKYIRITDIDEYGNFSTNKPASVIEKGWEDYILEEGDVLFVRTGSTTGKAYLYDLNDGQLVYAGFLILFKPDKNKLLPEYLKYYTNIYSYSKWVSIMSVRSGQPGINSSDYGMLKIPLPPIFEQKKITEILSTWDQAIKKTTVLIDKLQLRKKGLMQQLLTGEVKLVGFNKEWKEDKLGSYFSERKETGTENQILLSVGKNGVYPQNNSVKKDTSNTDKSKYKQIYKGDIGYNTMRMWQGRSALSQLDGIISPAYTVLKPKANTDPVYFSYLFKLEEMIHKFYRNSQGMVSDTWMCKFKDLSIIKFYAPSSKEEQTAIANILTNVDLEIEQQKAYLEKLNEQKKGLMQQLLTGKIRVN